MRVLVSFAAWGISVIAIQAHAAPPPVRAVSILEETAAPGAGPAYPLCEDLDIAAFLDEINLEIKDCLVETVYDFPYLEFGRRYYLLPTDPERRELCVKCPLLMDKLQITKVPRCLHKVQVDMASDISRMPYQKFFLYAFALCEVSGSASTASHSAAASTAITSPASSAGIGSQTIAKTNSSDSITAPLVGGITGAVAVVIIAAVAFQRARKRNMETTASETKLDDSETPSSLENGSAKYNAVPRTPHGRKWTGSKTNETQRSTGSGTSAEAHGNSEMILWGTDPVLAAVRIPHDGIVCDALLSRGGYGEVYKGTYKGETVAIKQLLPARRKDMVQIKAFLGEVKLLSTLDHERIVSFIGVAWNSLSDVCMVVEYMPRGDLRGVLHHWGNEDEKDGRRSRGFDAEKVQIALHIAHALAYLHSMQPVVLHRDLKSKNILLDGNFNAKLADFGISRVRADATMTSGVGTSLWMAPEVMLGERYNEKADIMDSAILQMVSLGRLTIEFSDMAHPALVQLGRDCVLLDATKRPTSGEVLHRVHQVFRQLS